MKILAITTIRSDYDLMSSLYQALNQDPEIELKLLIAGAHNSPTYGLTIEQIRDDGFDILLNSETLLDSDSKVGRLKSASIMLLSFIDSVANYNPDLILYAGDREDVIIGSLLGAYLSIPTMHFFSGDHAADGHVDNPVRHATSKLSTFHCASIEHHKERLLAIGEPSKRIAVIGSIALDRFLSFKSENMTEICSQLKIQANPKRMALVIFHPINEEKDEVYFEILHEEDDAPNSDPNNRPLIEMKNKYINNDQVYFYKTLPRNIFLSIFKNSDLIIGNSSAGILEAASIPIPAINVGKRQVGRISNKNVIFCDTSNSAITDAIIKATSDCFKKEISNIKNLYGDGKSIEKAVYLIKNTNFNELLYKKEDPLDMYKEAKND